MGKPIYCHHSQAPSLVQQACDAVFSHVSSKFSNNVNKTVETEDCTLIVKSTSKNLFYIYHTTDYRFNDSAYVRVLGSYDELKSNTNLKTHKAYRKGNKRTPWMW